MLSWRLGPILALVIVATASTAALYKQQTKARSPFIHMANLLDRQEPGGLVLSSCMTRVRCVLSLAVRRSGRCVESHQCLPVLAPLSSSPILALCADSGAQRGACAGGDGGCGRPGLPGHHHRQV